jgi:hypothetical protein
MEIKENNVEELGILYKGELVKTYLLCQDVNRKDSDAEEVWEPGEKHATINGKEVSWEDGQKVANEVRERLVAKK